jgi:hypothetical protein
MSSVRVLHHFWASTGGYRGLSTSTELEPELRERLDAIVAPLAASAGTAPVRSAFPVGRFAAITSSVTAGVDHAGRPRGASHTILVPLETARNLPGYRPHGVPQERFLGPEGSPAAAAAELPLEELALPPVPRALRLAAQHPAAASLLATLIAFGDRTAVVGDLEQSQNVLGLLSSLVPAASRASLAILGGPATAPDATTEVCVVRTTAEVPGGGRTRVDARNGKIDGHLPRGVAALAVSTYLDEGDTGAMARLETAFARWTVWGGRRPPRAFVRAFALLRRGILSEGGVALEARAWPRAAAAIPSAAKGEAPELARRLIAEGFDQVRSTRSVDLARSIVRTVRENVAAAPIAAEMRGYLAAEIARALLDLASRDDGLPAWPGVTPAGLRSLTAEAEALLALLVQRDAWDVRGARP